MDIGSLLETAANLDASDLHISPGIPPIVRLSGDLKPLCEEKVTSDMSR